MCNNLRTKSIPFYLKAQAVPRSKHLFPGLQKPVVEGCIRKTAMFFPKTRTKDISTLFCGKNVEFFNVGTYSNR